MSDGTEDLGASNVRCVRAGHGANCSSIGSVVDTLFATAAVGAAVFAAVVAAMKTEEVRVVKPRSSPTVDANIAPAATTAKDGPP